MNPVEAAAGLTPRNGLRAEVGIARAGFTLQAALQVTPGQTLALLGPNGAGKSTILRALAGLVPLSTGWVKVDDEIWDDAGAIFRPAHHRAAAIVFQDYRLFPHLTVLDNIAFPLRAKGLQRSAARREAAATLNQFGLTDLAGRRPRELSGGQAQRVALARALASRPRLLLLDEPLAALDASTRMEVRAVLRRYLDEFPGPSVLVTHDPLEAMMLADRLLVLEAGRVVQQGAPSEVARQPATQYVANLVGLNLYRGRLDDPRRGLVDLDGGGSLFAAGHEGQAEPCHNLARGTAMLVVVAPSAIAVYAHQPDSGSVRNIWPGTVTGLELLTDRIRVAVTGAPTAIVDITAAAVAELRLEPGSTVWLAAKATEVTAYPVPAQGTSPLADTVAPT